MRDAPDGGWVQRTREVIELPVVPVQVAEHVYMARTCPGCQRRCIPPAQLDGVVMGQQRLVVNPESSSGQALISLIAMLREDARLPIGTIQRYLRTVHELHVSMGAIVDAVHRTARKAQGVVAGILERIRGSPVVHADETGWREDGHNGYVWTLSTPTQRYFPCSSQGQALLRDSYDLCALYPDDAPLARWADAVHRLYTRAKAFTHPQARRRRTAQLALERQLLSVCHLYLTDTSAAQSRLCRRIQRPHQEPAPYWIRGTLRLRGRTRTRRTTTPPSAACATWSSVARSAAAPGRKRVPTAR